MTLAVVAKNAVRGIQSKSPAILTGLAVAGVVSTVVLAVQATPDALNRIKNLQEKENGLWIKAPLGERFRAVWPLYIPTAITGIGTIACIVGAQSVNMRRQAALVGAFTITEGAFQEYREKVVEALGAHKEERVRDAVIQKAVDENPPPSSEIVVIGSGNVLCLDSYTGRYFESSMEKIRKAQNDFNEMLLNGEMYASLNEFYHLLELEDTMVGEQVGFATENLLDINFSTAMTSDGRPCLAMSFRALPLQDYYKFR